MKHIFLSVLVLVACNTKPSAPATAGETQSGGADLPEGASIVPFGDESGLSMVVARDASGHITWQGFLADNERVGTWTEYHSNGMVKTTVAYVDGKKEGQFVELSNSGQLVRQCTYHNNMRHGEYKEYNFSTIKEERYYQNGNLEGVVKIYYPDGKIMEEGLYHDGARNGVSKWYDQQGNVSITYEYKNGQLVKN